MKPNPRWVIVLIEPSAMAPPHRAARSKTLRSGKDHHPARPFPDRSHALCARSRRAGAPSIAPGYHIADGAVVWVITEAVGDEGERAATTILLPEA
jgi:hypothetical protein